jgi:hypothetical protein
LAALAAIASLYAGATVNEALVLKTEATRLQAEASDQWAYYQAKGIKAAVAEASGTAWAAIGKPVPAQFAALGAVAALTRSRLAWLASLVMGASGTGLLIYVFLG